MTDENGNEMIQTAQQTSSSAAASAASAASAAAGNATGGNMTQGAERAVNETGEFVGDVGERVQDVFN
jgi:ribosomal protein L12E/L44/L45/RPP1/RPP2